MTRHRLRLMPLLALTSLLSTAVHAEGQIEINQAVVDQAGGFPYTISSAGNYVLTSDLVVTGDTTAIIIAPSSGVRIDLAGFRIVGPPPCNLGGCTAGTASGITSSGFSDGLTVVGGEISGFSGSCIDLDTTARVEDLLVSQCGQHGIVAGDGSIVARNRVSTTARSGLSLGSLALYFDNTVRLSGLDGGGDRAIAGGRATGGNVCSDETCFRVPMRLWYISATSFNGANAANPGNCDPGFHFATLGELSAAGSLRYDVSRSSAGLADSGEGPPSLNAWIRTGGSAISGVNGPGYSNCAAWTSTTEFGSRVGISGSAASSVPFAPWIAGTLSCAANSPIVCIED